MVFGDISNLASLGAFLGVFLAIFLVFYVYSAFVLMALAKKTKTENGWLAWIPIANIYLMVNIAKLPWWYTLLIIFLPMIPFLGAIASMVLSVYVWWKIAERIKKPTWLAILMLVPVVNLIIMGIFAWGK